MSRVSLIAGRKAYWKITIDFPFKTDLDRDWKTNLWAGYICLFRNNLRVKISRKCSFIDTQGKIVSKTFCGFQVEIDKAWGRHQSVGKHQLRVFDSSECIRESILEEYHTFFAAFLIGINHWLNMELDQSWFGLHVTWFAQLYSLAGTPQSAPSPRILTRYTRALLVSQDRRHVLVTLWLASTLPPPPQLSQETSIPLS